MKTEKYNEQHLIHLLEKFVIDHAKSIHINTGSKAILLQVKGKRIITTVYEQGSMNKVVYHGANSVKELVAMFNEMGISLWSLTKRLAAATLFWKKDKTLHLELLSKQITK